MSGLLDFLGKAGPLGAIGSIASSLIGNKGSRNRQHIADLRNIEFWKMQNAYNHPLQQMERLKEAGLNPNLIYGQSAAGATGSSGAQPHASKAAPYSFSNPATAAFQAQLANSASIKNLADSKGIGLDNTKKANTLDGAISAMNAQFKKDKLQSDLDAMKLINPTFNEKYVAAANASLEKAIQLGEQSAINTEMLKMDKTLKKNGFHKGQYMATMLEGILGIDPSQLGEKVEVWGYELPITKRAALLGLVGAFQAGKAYLHYLNALRGAKQVNIKNKSFIDTQNIIPGGN